MSETTSSLPGVGTPVPAWRLERVEPAKMLLMVALLRDPNPIHFDRSSLRVRGIGDRLVNQGPLNIGYVCNCLQAWTGPGSLRRLQVRFTANVLEGDAVEAGGVVTGVRRSDHEHLVDCDVWLDRGDGTRALEGTATVAMPLDSA